MREADGPDRSDPGLEGALEEAFGSPESRGASILDRIERLTGVSSQLLLHDEAEDDSPLLRVATADDKPVEDDSRYQIAGEIAKGGVGAVYKGRDRDLGRDVAVKVLRQRHVGSPDVLQRFVEEAQIGGQLQHPGIVPVYSLGLQPDGRPYFAMKLVKGRTLAAALRERKDPSQDRRRLLRVFERICQTMAYAHARGVIHRDLKPANVMLGSFGEVLVVDWGFGKVLGREEPEPAEPQATVVTTVRSGSVGSESMAGSVMGTPAYMPPEQALGHVDELDRQTDVFALGAILCEILTGQPPYAGAPKDRLVQASQARLDDAFARLDACGADPDLLDLAKRCLAPMRDDRPADAGEVAAAMGEHLADAEARAHRAEVEAVHEGTRLGREQDHARRERRAKRLTIALAATLLVAVATAGGAFLTKDARDRERAVRSLPQVEQAMEDAVRLQGEGKWPEALAVARKARHLAGEVDRATVHRADALLGETEEGLAAADAEKAQSERDEALLAALAESRLRRCDESDPQTTDAAFVAAFRGYGLDPEADPAGTAGRIRGRRDAFALTVAAALDDWAWLRRIHASLKERDWAKLLDVADAVDPNPTQIRLRDLVREWDVEGLGALASDEAVGDLPARSLTLLGQALRSAGKTDEAIALLEAAARRHPEEPWILFNLGCALEGAERYGDAAGCHSAALASRPDSVELRHRLGICLAAQDPPDYAAAVEVFRVMFRRRPSDGHAMAHLSMALGAQGKQDEALELAREAADLAPRDGAARHALATALGNVGRYEEAIAECREAIRLSSASVSRAALADLLRETGRHDEAITECRDMLEVEPGHPRALLILGVALLDAGRVDEAEEQIREALGVLTKPRNRAGAWLNLGLALAARRRVDEAIEAYREAIRVDPEFLAAYANLAPVLSEKGLHEEALEMALEAVELDPRSPGVLGNLALVHYRAGRYEESLAAARRSLEIDPGFANGHAAAAAALNGLNLTDEAIVAARKAIQLDPEMPEAYSNLANALTRKGRWAEAVPHYRASLRLCPEDTRVQGQLGLALMNIGEVEEAEKEFREAVRRKPDYAEGHGNLGALLLETGRLEEGIVAVRESIRLDPTRPENHANLGTGLCLEGRADEAIPAFREALRLAPERAEWHVKLGDALLWTGRPEDALAAFREAARLGLETAGLRCSSGLALRELGRHDEAIAVLREAIHLEPNSAVAHTYLGCAIQHTGCRLEEAIALHRKAIELDPRCGAAHGNLGNCLCQAGQLEESLASYERAVRLDPRIANAWNGLGSARYALGDLDRAVEAYREAIRRRPVAAMHGNLALVLRELDLVEEATLAYREALRLDPDNALAHGGLGWIALGRGDVEGAIAALRAAVRLAPKNGVHLQNLGIALLVAGRPDEADVALRHALRVRPELSLARRFSDSTIAKDLPALLAGKRQAADARERVDLALACWPVRRFATAARLIREALVEEPGLGTDLAAGHRFAAACWAVRAGCGHGRDGDALDGAARAGWRKQALVWLREDLALRRQQIDGREFPGARPAAEALTHWLRDADLYHVRGEKPLTRLPAGERDPWRAFWQDVEKARKLAKGR